MSAVTDDCGDEALGDTGNGHPEVEVSEMSGRVETGNGDRSAGGKTPEGNQEPHGRYPGDSLEGTNEEYAVGVVRNGRSGTEIGVGKPVSRGLVVLMRRRDRNTMRGVPCRGLRSRARSRGRLGDGSCGCVNLMRDEPAGAHRRPARAECIRRGSGSRDPRPWMER